MSTKCNRFLKNCTYSTKCMQHTCRNNVLLATVPVEYDGQWRDARWLVAGSTLQFALIGVGHHVGSTDRLRHVDTGWATAVGGTHTISCLTPCTPLAFYTLAQVWKTPQISSFTSHMASTNDNVPICVVVCVNEEMWTNTSPEYNSKCRQTSYMTHNIVHNRQLEQSYKLLTWKYKEIHILFRSTVISELQFIET